jgi:hypothetical protein
MWLGERQDAMDKPLTVIASTDQDILELLRELLRDAGYDALSMDSTGLSHHYVQIDIRQAATDAGRAPIRIPRDPQDAALEVLGEIYQLLDELPFGWQIAVIKALLGHVGIIAHDRLPPPQHTTLSA